MHTEHAEQAMSEIAEEAGAKPRRRYVANEDLIRKARKFFGVAVFRRFATTAKAKDARALLLAARGEELKGWAIFTRGPKLYVVACDRNGVLPGKWGRFVR